MKRELEWFRRRVIRELEKKGVTEVSCAGRTRQRRCDKDGVKLEKFRGLKEGEYVIVYACPECGHVSMKSLRFLKPIKL